jgi:tetratricopeptide (TPR) repeat protein
MIKFILWSVFLTTNLKKAMTLYNENQLSKAAKLLIKEKSPCKDSLKLLMMVEFNIGNYVKAIFAAKNLLNKTVEKIDVKDACNTIRICCQHIKDKKMELEYSEKSVRCDNSEGNAQAIYHLLLLYYHEQMFVKVEKLAETLLQWQVCRASVSFILIELASKQGNKNLLLKRLEGASDFYDEFNVNQLGIIIDFYIDTGLFKLADTTIKYIIDKFGCDATSLRIALLLAEKDTVTANKYWHQDKHLLEPHEAYYFEAKLALSRGDYNQEFLALAQAAEAKKSGLKNKNTNNDIALFNSTLPKLAKTLPSSTETYGCKNTFIMGFPRSGTTLLDNILDTQNNMLVLSERSIFTHLTNTYKTFKKYPLDLYKLNPKEINLLRQRYLQHINEQGYGLPESGGIIEKDPYLTEALPFIQRIFPAAKIIITLRHPLDVCMSCFQTHFSNNIYSNNLITMEDIVNRYINVFTLLERYQSELLIQPHFIRYEDLVTDIKGEMSKVFAYMEVAPNDDYLSFHEHADSKFVNSASRGQTNQPLYKSSMYKFRNYDEHLAPYKEKLRYFIEKFGYDF